MSPEILQIIKLLVGIVPFVVLLVGLAVGGSVLSTWLKIRNGYPLSNSWGMPMHPKKIDQETAERIKLLTTENAQLRAELGSMRDRLENVERIVTDQPSKMSREIETPAIHKGRHA